VGGDAALMAPALFLGTQFVKELEAEGAATAKKNGRA
jgi:hypothetical protein